jgi:dienelactone hydrolase
LLLSRATLLKYKLADLVIIADLNKDPIPEGALGSPEFDLGAWFGKHGADTVRPPLDKVIAALKAKGITSFAATGYCFGGRYVADLVLEDQLKVAIVAHPSLIKIPDDLEAIKKHSVPFLWNTCEVDDYVSPARP